MKNPMPNIYHEADSAADLAIVGLGPGGLYAAIKAAKTKKRVIAFTDRREYIRGQRVELESDVVNLLESLRYPEVDDEVDENEEFEDALFWGKFRSEGSVQLKDLENYLFRKLKKEEAKGRVTIIPLDKNSSSKSTEQTTIQSIEKDIEENAEFIQLTNGENYYFKNLLAADGAHHSVADLIKIKLGKDINYSKHKIQERHPYHAVVQLKISPRSLDDLEIRERSSQAQRQLKTSNLEIQINNFHWEKSHSPKFYIYTNIQKTKFYFAGEIPQFIYDQKDPDERKRLLKEWASIAISQEYELEKNELGYRQSRRTPAKDKLQANAFEFEIQQVNQPVIHLTNGVFSQIGDARRTPNFYMGHGVNDAIRGANSFIEVFNSGSNDYSQHEEYLRELDENVDKKMEAIETFRLTRKQVAERTLLTALTNLIKHLEKKDRDQNEVVLLKEAKNIIQEKGDLSKLYEIMPAVSTAAKRHRHEGIIFDFWRWFKSAWDKNHSKTKSEILAEDVQSNMKPTIGRYS